MVIKREESCSPLNRFVRTVQSKRGFTLVELIVVCAILGVLATMAFTGISDFKNKTKTSRAAAEIRGLEKNIIAFASEKGTFPPNLGAVGMANQKDPWSNSYVYVLREPLPLAPPRDFFGPINSDFDLYSKGATGAELIDSPVSITDPASDDDIIRAGDGSFVGTAELYGL